MRTKIETTFTTESMTEEVLASYGEFIISSLQIRQAHESTTVLQSKTLNGHPTASAAALRYEDQGIICMDISCEVVSLEHMKN